jgi:hypothetical protein
MSDTATIIYNLRERVAELELLLEATRAELREALRQLWHKEGRER